MHKMMGNQPCTLRQSWVSVLASLLFIEDTRDNNNIQDFQIELLADPGKAQTVKDSSFSYKVNYVIGIKNFLNPKGHPNPIRVVQKLSPFY